MNMNTWLFMYELFDPYYKYTSTEHCEYIRYEYIKMLEKYLVGKTVKFNFGFQPGSDTGVVKLIDYNTGITPVVCFVGGDTLFLDSMEMFKYSIVEE